jgi:DNA-binding MarR family transcriptional regulator
VLERLRMSISPDECAHAVLDVVPLVMRCIRAEMRSHRAPDLSVPQFRTLVYLSQHDGSSLSDLAWHLGLTSPSASVMVNGLVGRGLVARQAHPVDRRRVTLALTPVGQAAMESARAMTRSRLAERLAELPEPERVTIVQAMCALTPVFAPVQGVETEAVR